MKIKSVFIGMLLLVKCLWAEEPDTLKHYSIVADAHGFMCPFLTPKYIDRIKTFCNCSVQKDEQLTIHVFCHKNDSTNEAVLLNFAELIGYERKNIHVKREK